MFDPRKIVEALNRHRVEYITIGGFAATLYGCPEQTFDLDILYADSSDNRRIIVEKSGSACTVVWNPWIAKAKALPDFGDDEWPFMVCIGTAKSQEKRRHARPGQSHTM